jgi:hypothetical protein
MIVAGLKVLAARDALPHSVFIYMIENELSFGASTARRLMAVTADRRLLSLSTLLPRELGSCIS